MRGIRRPAGASLLLRAAVAIALVGTVLVVAASIALPRNRAGAGPTSPAPTSEGFDWSTASRPAVRPATLSIGVTHTQYSIDDWGDPAALASAKQVLAATASYQNQHIFGWGALNPEPAPRRYDWASLDRRMALIAESGGVPVITLCCAPDWMKGGRPGQTDWQRLHVAPRPEHYGDFAALAVTVARRYPQVRHYLVWNEMKGFWDNSRNRWNYEAYTELYNAVYDALKAAVPGVSVGGPYVVMDLWAAPTAGGRPSTLAGACGTVDQRSLDVIEYWLRNKHGADFVAVDGGTLTRDAGEVGSASARSAVFGGLTRWLRQRTDLPVWWSEFHVGRDGAGDTPELVASAVGAMLHMADERAAVALLWQPQLGTRDDRAPALWSSTERAGGGRPLPLAEATARLQRLLAAAGAADAVSWPVPEVGAVRGGDALLLVNTSDRVREVRMSGMTLRLRPYEMRYTTLPPGAPAAPPSWWTPAIDECVTERTGQPR